MAVGNDVNSPVILGVNVVNVDFDFLTLRLHVRRQPSLGRRQCETKTSASGTELYKIIIQLHTQCRILRKAKPLAQLMQSRVCHEFACPIVPWVPPCSCTRRIPKQHSFDPPVRRQICHMHRKFPVMFEALFKPRVQSMLLRECYCLAIPMIQNLMPRCVPFHGTWRPDERRLNRHHFCQPQLVCKSKFLTNNHVINGLAAC